MVTKKVVSKKTVSATKAITSAPKVKVAKKTVNKKTEGKKKLVVATGAHCFWVKDGKVLKDLTDLEVAFKTMSAEVFTHHVTKAKNDFATWVEVILKDKACATDLKKAKKPATAKTVITKHLKSYTK